MFILIIKILYLMASMGSTHIKVECRQRAQLGVYESDIWISLCDAIVDIDLFVITDHLTLKCLWLYLYDLFYDRLQVDQ